MPAKKILYADDDPRIREALQLLLGCEGYETIEASNGEEVLRELDEDFRLLYDFYVVASTEEVNVGDLVDTEKIDICFQII